MIPFLVPGMSHKWRLHCVIFVSAISVEGTLLFRGHFLDSQGIPRMEAPLYSAVVKISSCRANGTSRWGIIQLGILFGSTVFPFYFPTKVDGGHVLNSCKKFPGPPAQTVRFVSVICKCRITIMITETDYYLWVTLNRSLFLCEL